MRRGTAVGLVAALLLAVGGLSGAAGTAQARAATPFLVGAAVADFSPPCGPDGTPALNACTNPPGFVDPTGPAACPASAAMTGKRVFAFSEPYQDLQGSGHYDQGDPWVDCDLTNGLGRWEGNFIGGGGNSPRFATRIADPVTARAVVVSNGTRTIAVEVEDHEGLFDTYQDQVRQKVVADGFNLDGVFISSTHDESAPDTIGLYGVTSATSSVNHYWGNWLVAQSAKAIETAYRGRTAARIRYSEAIEPANLRQCFSSYPYVDDQLMPVLQAVDAGGHPIVTLTDVSQHTESLGFNHGSALDPGAPTPTTLDQENSWYSADWPVWLRSKLEQDLGGVAIEMAGSVGSNETPEVFGGPLSRTPQKYIDESHPAGCRTLYTAPGPRVPLGYFSESKQLGQGLAGAVEQSLGAATDSVSTEVSGTRAQACVLDTNVLFGVGGAAGLFGNRPTYDPTCTTPEPPLPNGSTAGLAIQTQVAAYRIGDATFVAMPGEVFPFTYLRSFEGPADMPCPDPDPQGACASQTQSGPYPLPPWLMPHMHTPYRFIAGLGEDMIGYIFPQGNGVGVPGEYPLTNPQASGDDRFGCGHSDDSESANSQAGKILGDVAVPLLDAIGGTPEEIDTGRYVMPDGSLSRNPEGAPASIKCNVDNVFIPRGPASAVWLPGGGVASVAAQGPGQVVTVAGWMSLSGRPQSTPDRNTRGYFDAAGARHWLDVFPDISGQPAAVNLAGSVPSAPAAGGQLPNTAAGRWNGIPGGLLLLLPLALYLRRRRRPQNQD